MSVPSSSLPEVISLIEEAAELLGNADHKCERAIQDANLPQGAPEIAALEEHLHAVTHETCSALGFALHDIKSLLARLELRRKYAVFTLEHFQRITEQGWSTPFVTSFINAIRPFLSPNSRTWLKAFPKSGIFCQSCRRNNDS